MAHTQWRNPARHTGKVGQAEMMLAKAGGKEVQSLGQRVEGKEFLQLH